MNKINGKKSDFALVRDEGTRVVIGYGLTKIGKDNYEWYEVYLPTKQLSQLTFEVIKKAIEADINADTVEQITRGFSYTILHGEQAGTQVNVWLSKENQSDFHAMHMNSAALSFPVRYKVGELEDGTAVFEEFADAEEMHAICISTTQHVLTCQQAGWARKGAIDWSAYKALYPEPANNDQPSEEEVE